MLWVPSIPSVDVNLVIASSQVEILLVEKECVREPTIPLT
jgi:hypothetical protein